MQCIELINKRKILSILSLSLLVVIFLIICFFKVNIKIWKITNLVANDEIFITFNNNHTHEYIKSLDKKTIFKIKLDEENIKNCYLSYFNYQNNYYFYNCNIIDEYSIQQGNYQFSFYYGEINMLQYFYYFS